MMPLIVEGLLTTTAEDGSPHVAPMGPIIDRDWKRFVLRPFQTSTTYCNLKRTGECVFHVTDDVELIAKSAIGLPLPKLVVRPALRIRAPVLDDACRWYELTVEQLDDREQRTRIECRVLHFGWIREFFGFNRAKHAVLEAAIVATRLHLLSRDDVLSDLDRLRIIVDKTAGDAEARAFALLERYVQDYDKAGATGRGGPAGRRLS